MSAPPMPAPSAPPSGPPWDLAIEQAPLAFLDLEMTGSDPSVDRICEVAVQRRVGGAVVAELVSLVRPGVAVAASEDVHGISDVALAAAPALSELSERLRAVLEGAVIVGHAIAKDLAFLEAAAARGETFAPPEHALDTLVLSRRAVHSHGHSLASLAHALALPRPTHRALPDVLATEALFDVVVTALRPRTPRDLWQVRAGERRASMRDDVLAALTLAVETSGHARICYRVPRRPAHAFTMRIARLAPPHVEGLLLETGVVRVLRGDRILWAEPVAETR